jgi:hypothetical protein
VGITSTPLDSEIVASPRGPAAGLSKLRVDTELPPMLVVAPVAPIAPVARVSSGLICATSVAIISIDRHASTGPRAPPA